MKVIEQKKFVLSDAVANNNKVWQYSRLDDGTVEFQWGRIGKSLQSKIKAISDKELTSKVKAQLKEGYKELEILAAPTGPSGPMGSSVMKSTAVRDIAGDCPTLKTLVQRLAEANRHEIKVASGGQMDIDLSTGIISTPLGVVSQDNITKARDILQKLAPIVQIHDFENNQFKTDLSEYLMLVPQKVGHRKWYESFMPDIASVAQQSTLLNQLESSIGLVEQRLASATTVPDQTKPARAFDVTLKLIDPTDAAFKRIELLYKKSLNSKHDASKLKLKRVFAVNIPHMTESFALDGAKMTNQWDLWHGTRIFNILSIMKRGFVMPKQIGSSAAICGAMFADGIYFSDQSSKSLNYAMGYWDSGAKTTNCFMFLNKVAMGNYQVPIRSTSKFPDKGYDSYYAQPGKSGILNNEMIVFRATQINPEYLVEFDA